MAYATDAAGIRGPGYAALAICHVAGTSINGISGAAVAMSPVTPGIVVSP
jgi:hypothetical protein